MGKPIAIISSTKSRAPNNVKYDHELPALGRRLFCRWKYGATHGSCIDNRRSANYNTLFDTDRQSAVAVEFIASIANKSEDFQHSAAAALSPSGGHEQGLGLVRVRRFVVIGRHKGVLGLESGLELRSTTLTP